MSQPDDGVIRTRRKRAKLAILAIALVGVLVLSACVPLFGLIERLLPGQAPAPTEVIGTNFGDQKPNWAPCYDGMQCAEVFAPLDWQDPAAEEHIKLALVKQPALAGDPLGTIFVNPGGPGASSVHYIAQSIDYAVGAPLQQAYDIIGWDPRGVGASSAVTCLDDAQMDEYLYGLGATHGLESGSEEWIDAAVQESAEYGETCLKNTGPLLEHVDTQSTVHDLDMLRTIVGDPKLNYLGYSYGTYIGALYADNYPERVGRLVLDGALDPTTTTAEVVREQTRGFELALRSYVTDCLTRQECPLTGSVDEAMAQWGSLLDDVEENPLTGSDGRMVTSGTLLTAIIMPLYAQANWPYLDQLFVATSEGNADVALALADSYYDRVDGTYMSNLITAFSAINCLDYPTALPLDIDRMHADAAELEEVAPTIGAYQGYGDVGCAGWPFAGTDHRSAVSADGADPILVIGTTGDPATPFRWAEALAQQLSSGVLLAYQGEGHTAYGQSACVNAIVEDYFLTGAVPESGARCL